jgi:hypothetical protein
VDSGSRKHAASRLTVQHLREALNPTSEKADPALDLLSWHSPP